MLTKGDSLHGSDQKPMDLQKGLRRWLRLVDDPSYNSGGPRFPIGRQNDGNSCGICVLNAMDHAMFGADLFTHEGRHLVRMDLFRRIARFLLLRVGSLPCWTHKHLTPIFSPSSNWI